MADVLRKLNIVVAGGNYQSVKRAIKRHSMDMSHFKAMAWSKDKILGPRRPLCDYLSNEHSIRSCQLKTRLISENILPYICNKCSLDVWLEIPIPLELHHKNGNSDDNSLNNLELLCPNCHAMTDNYRGKNQSRAKP